MTKECHCEPKATSNLNTVLEDNSKASTALKSESASFLSKNIQTRQSSFNAKKIGGIFIVLCFLTVSSFLLHQNYFKIFPNNTVADEHFVRANDLYLHNELTESIDEYRKAIAYSPQRADLRYRYSWALFHEGQPHEAVKEMKLAVLFNPKDMKAQAHLGEMLQETESLTEAAKQFDLVFENEKDVYILLRAAQCWEWSGDLKKAIQHYKRCADLRAKSEVAWLRWSKILKESNDLPESLRVVDLGLKNIPNSAHLHYTRGQILVELKRSKEGVAELQQAARLNPSGAEQVSDIIRDIGDEKLIAKFVIPLTKKGDSFFVEAVINEKVRVKLLIDTGAEECVISPKIGKLLSLDLAKAETVQIGGVTGDDIAPVVNLNSINVAGAKAQNISSFVYDVESSDSSDGILGMSFLKKFAFYLDASKRLLELTPKNLIEVK